MIPWGAIAVAAWAASRGLDPNRPPSPGLPLAFLVVVARWGLALAVLVAASGLAGAWPPGAPVVMPLGLALAFVLARPTALLERVLVPRGLARAAYWWAYVTVPMTALYDTPGGRAFYAARALLRRPTPDDDAAALAERALTAPRTTQRTGLSVAAEGLLAVARGSVDHGRVLLASLDALDEAAVPAAARDVARTWLVADALAAGDVERALRHTQGPGFAAWPALVRVEVERARGVKSPWWAEPRRWALWVLSPARRATRRFFDGWRERTLTLPAETGDALADALAVHRLLLAADARTKGYATALAEACRRWEAALASTALRARVERRRLALNLAEEAPALLDRFAAEVEGDLVAFASAVDGPLAELDATTLGERVRYAVREADCGEVEALLGTLRAQTGGDFPATPEAWALFARLRDRTDAALRRHGDDARDALGSEIFHGATNWTCRLYNERRERALGRAVFVWIRAHADALPAKDLQLAIKNARVAGH